MPYRENSKDEFKISTLVGQDWSCDSESERITQWRRHPKTLGAEQFFFAGEYSEKSQLYT